MDTKYPPDVVAELVLDVVRESEPPAESLEEAVERIQHREAIHNVLASYCYFQDEHRFAESTSLFTEDCELIYTGTIEGTWNGRDAVLASRGAPLKRSDPAFGRGASREELAELQYKHLLMTEMIKLGAGNRTARVIAYAQIAATRGVGEKFERGAHEATYYIDFQLTEGSGWLMKRMILLSDQSYNPLFNNRS